MKKNTSAEAQGTRTPVAMSCSRAHLAACRWKCAQSRPCDRTYLRPCLRRGARAVLVFNFTPHATHRRCCASPVGTVLVHMSSRADHADTGSLAIVQWTHTLVMKPMLLAARQQILRARWAEHHVILSPCGQNETSCDDLMEAASPLRENVTCSTPTGIARDLPAFANLRATFHGRKFSAPETVNVGAMRWCWNSCDGPYLHWYKLHGQTLSCASFGF